VAASAFENARLAQEARKAAIVNVIGDISHDIKNMLTPIQTGVWTLEPMLDELFESLEEVRVALAHDTHLAGRVEEAALMARDDYKWILAGALDAADKVQTRTKEIADAVKGEVAEPNFESDNLNDTATEVARSLTILALDARIDLKLELDAELPDISYDRKQMYNALYNLVNNAIPETPAGGMITIRTVRGSTRASDGTLEDVIYVEVIDTGKGIPERIRARLFTDDAVSTKPGGTGLGTRIVAGIVKRHNGTIEVISEEGKGSTFRIRLPLTQEK
jgi:signal transduction histidine kinase